MINSLSRHLAFLLIVTLLVSRLGNLTHERFVEPIQEYISHEATVYSDDSGKGKTPYILKSKKMLPDISNLEEIVIDLTLPAGLEIEVVLQKFTMPPKVYLDILVPPDESPSYAS